MFALMLYWTWTSAPFADVPGTACAGVKDVNRAALGASVVTRARLAVESVNHIAIDASTRDCC